MATTSANKGHKGAKHEEEADEEEEEEEEEEPQLKYASLTKAQGTLYKNADAVSALLVAGDKMVGSRSSKGRPRGLLNCPDTRNA